MGARTLVQQNSESVIDVDKTKYIDEPRRRDSGDCVLPTSLSKANLVTPRSIYLDSCLGAITLPETQNFARGHIFWVC